jgi:2-methylcitrate dehydratase PrpD
MRWSHDGGLWPELAHHGRGRGSGGVTTTQQLATFALGTRWEDIPDRVRAKASLMILDGIGLGLAAAREDFALKAMKALPELGSGDYTVIGFEQTLPIASAPLINGMLIHAFDFDDTHHPLVIHNEGVLLPPTIAAAERQNASGREFLAAAAIGFEIALRVARGTKAGAIHGRGFHPTATCGVFGGAAAASRLMGLTEEQLTNAFGLAGSQGSGNMEWQSDGSWSKRFQPGWSGHGAIVGTLLAAQGFTAPATALEGPRGFWATHVGEDAFDESWALDGLGSDWELDRTEFKPYPCAGALQATVRACIELRNQHHLQPEDIEDVECRVRMGDRPAGQGQERVFANQRPEGDYGAHFSTPFIAAVALTKGRLALSDFEGEAFHDPLVTALAAKIRRTDDPNHGRPKYASGHVLVRTKDGRLLEHRQHIHPGHVEFPVMPEEVMEKYTYNAQRLVSAEKAKALADHIMSLEQLGSIKDLTRQLQVEEAGA